MDQIGGAPGVYSTPPLAGQTQPAQGTPPPPPSAPGQPRPAPPLIAPMHLSKLLMLNDLKLAVESQHHYKSLAVFCSIQSR